MNHLWVVHAFSVHMQLLFAYQNESGNGSDDEQSDEYVPSDELDDTKGDDDDDDDDDDEDDAEEDDEDYTSISEGTGSGTDRTVSFLGPLQHQ